MDMDRLKVPMQIKVHPGGRRSYNSVRINGRNIPGPQRNFLWHLLLRECLVSQKDVEETEPWQWESILCAHLIVHAMVCFLGLLVVFVIFLTLCAMKNTCWVLRPCAHTCCCLMVWGCFGDKSRFSRGIGGPHVFQILCISLCQEFLIEVWQQLKDIKWGGLFCVAYWGYG